jgi:hypothetical protein
MPSRLIRRSFATATFCAAVLSVRAAHARSCKVNGDCPRGFQCGPLGTAGDTGIPSVCTSLPCGSDSDCAPSTRCGPQNMCVPQWQVPCTTEAECGPGFTCAESDANGPNSYIQCGPGQYDASIPSFATATSISCADVTPTPQPPPGYIPVCEAGGTCLSVTWKTCSAPQTACKSDLDCPSTWTCSPCVDTGVFPAPATPDAAAQLDAAACTKVCAAPNSDLLLPVVVPSTEGVEPNDSGGGGGTTAGAGAGPRGTAAQGGCQVIAEESRTGCSWTSSAFMALGLASWIRRRRGPAERIG